MRQIFADTSYYLALANRRDKLHAEAIRLLTQIDKVTR